MQIAEKICQLLKEPPFGLTVFLARATNNPYSLNEEVLTRLAYADYFLFINFHRKVDGFPGSLYSHQELAMALALGHRQLLVFSERDAPNLGIIQFMVHQSAERMNTSITPFGPMIDCSVQILPFWSFRLKSGTRWPT